MMMKTMRVIVLWCVLQSYAVSEESEGTVYYIQFKVMN